MLEVVIEEIHIFGVESVNKGPCAVIVEGTVREASQLLQKIDRYVLEVTSSISGIVLGMLQPIVVHLFA